MEDNGQTSFTALSEIYTSIDGVDTITPGPSLPRASADHCVLQIGASEFLFLGGVPYDDSVYKYDFDLGRWTPLADMPTIKRGPYCGVVVRGDDSKDVIVSSGYGLGGYSDNSLIYDVTTDTWTVGPNKHPHSKTFNGISVQYGDTFLSMHGDSVDNVIYEYNVATDAYESINVASQWDHYLGMAFLVPNDYYPCLDEELELTTPSANTPPRRRDDDDF